MIRQENPERMVDEFSPRDIPDTPYGLPFVRGEHVDVSFGHLTQSLWYGHSFDRARLVFTFNRAGGWIADTSNECDGWSDLFSLWPHQFCFIPPNCETVLSWEEPADLVLLYCDSTAIEAARTSLNGISLCSLHPVVRRDLEISRLLQMFLRLCRETCQPKAPYVEGIAAALASRTLDQLSPSNETSRNIRPSFPRNTIDRTNQYVDEHLKETMFVSDLAKQAALSPDHFARRFKVTTGLSPKQFVINRRVEKVCELFETGKFNVAEAAREVGFHDPSHLNRCFRKLKGCSPKEALKAVGSAVSYQ
jgi:AraC-like DNA-binding protein